jgi:respiratory burst oxidase
MRSVITLVDSTGMVESSKEFAVGIFDALARRRRQNLERITKEELYDFWLQISDQSFDARLQIFFDMYCTPHFSLFHSTDPE